MEAVEEETVEGGGEWIRRKYVPMSTAEDQEYPRTDKSTKSTVTHLRKKRGRPRKMNREVDIVDDEEAVMMGTEGSGRVQVGEEHCSSKQGSRRKNRRKSIPKRASA